MKIVYLSLLVSLAGCSTQPKPSEPELFASVAARYIQEFKTNCGQENKKLWGTSLCVPLIILNPESLQAVTSELDPAGKFEKVNDVYTGTYSGAPVYANTSVEWGDQRWSMVLWPLPEDPIARTQLMFHEAFHSIQNDIGYPMNSAMNSHLDSEHARVLIRLEWNALLQALRSPEPAETKSHLRVALRLRQERFKEYPAAEKNENGLELNEGLAEYTGVKLRGSSAAETNVYLEQKLLDIPRVFSLTRSSAYYSGPLYGLILDKVDSHWKTTLAKTKSLSKTAEDLFQFRLLKKEKMPQASALELYGYSSLLKFEKQRAAEIKTKIAKYLKQIKQPGHIEITLESPQMVFNPYGILSLSPSELIYTTYEVTDRWGKLIVKDGVYLKTDKRSTLSISPPTSSTDSSAQAPQWELHLNPGWKIIKIKNIFTVKKI